MYDDDDDVEYRNDRIDKRNDDNSKCHKNNTNERKTGHHEEKIISAFVLFSLIVTCRTTIRV